jgi:alkylation response protein AidB-like acyl-CoA dehydrogenase
MLGLMQAKTEAARAICMATAAATDAVRLTTDKAVRQRHKRREDFLVPIAKAWSTDRAVEVASMGVQVHGGMGFIEETGAAQYYRDARIAPIYEGTNGIQAGDLVGRKLGSDGLAARELALDIADFMQNKALQASFQTELTQLQTALDAFTAASEHLLKQKAEAPLDVAAAATTYLTLAGDLVGGWLLLKGALKASAMIETGDADGAWLKQRIAITRLFFAHTLSHASAHLAAIRSGYGVLGELDVNPA